MICMFLRGPRRYSSPGACTSPTTVQIPILLSVILISQSTCNITIGDIGDCCCERAQRWHSLQIPSDSSLQVPSGAALALRVPRGPHLVQDARQVTAEITARPESGSVPLRARIYSCAAAPRERRWSLLGQSPGQSLGESGQSPGPGRPRAIHAPGTRIARRRWETEQEEDWKGTRAKRSAGQRFSLFVVSCGDREVWSDGVVGQRESLRPRESGRIARA